MKTKNLNSRKAYWRANTALIRNLLLVWALVSIVMSILLVEPLNNFQLGGVPFGFWMAQQGSIYVFVVLIFTYAIQMDKLDRKYAESNRTSLSVNKEGVNKEGVNKENIRKGSSSAESLP